LIDGEDVSGEPETLSLRYVHDCNSIFSKEVGISMFHLNIRSIKRNYDQLVVLLESFKIKFDCIVLSETWEVEDINHFTIEGYNTIYNHGHYNQNDGVVVFVKRELAVEVIFDKTDNNLTFTNLNFTFLNKTVSILAIYRPPSYAVDSFLERLESYLDSNLTSQINFIVGDINIDLLGTDRETVNLYRNILGYRGFVSLINSPTRVSQESETCIDHIFLKHQNNVCTKITPIVLHSDITDHYPVLLKLEIPSKNVNINTSVKSFKKTDMTKLNASLENESWESVYMCDNLSESFDNFIHTLKSHIEVSSQERQVRGKTVKIKPWITVGLITSMNRRDRMKKQLLKHPSDQLLSEYRNYRNTLTKLVSKQKYNYYSNKIDNACQDIKKVWNTIKEFIGREKNENVSITLQENGLNISNPEMVANKLNEYFIKVGDSFVPTYNEHPSASIKNPAIPTSMFLEPVTEIEINNIIVALRDGASVGTDGVSVNIIKNCRQYLLSPLVYLINKCFKRGEFPSSLKHSIVTPIYKKSGSRRDPTNYRPISVISQFSKVFEKAVVVRLNNYFDKNDIISHRQFGFRKNLSTQDALYYCFKNIYNSINANNKTIGIFLDLRKAFDSVSHGLLLEKLESYGIRGPVLNLFRSYLTGRSQVVRVGNAYSRPLVINTGVPQGTVLGPIMFIAYINDLLKTDMDGEIVTYADDTALVFSADTWDQARQKAEIGIRRVVSWLDLHRLSLNVGKTHFMPFFAGSTEQIHFSYLTVHSLSCHGLCHCNERILITHETKYLGLIVGSRLRWEGHANQLTTKLKPFLYMLYQLRQILNHRTLITVYRSLIESIIQYGIIIWGGTYKTLINSLYIRQKYLIKIILFKNKLYSTEQLFLESGLLDIQSLYILKSCVFVKKVSELRGVIDHPFDTRNRLGGTLAVPRMRTALNQKFITYLGPRFYNNIPASFKTINNLSMFSKKLYSHLSQHRLKFLSLL